MPVQQSQEWVQMALIALVLHHIIDRHFFHPRLAQEIHVDVKFPDRPEHHSCVFLKCSKMQLNFLPKDLLRVE